jgi:hypothetical protein
MGDLELGLWVLGMTLAAALLMGPGLWSERWGWSVLDRLTRKSPPKAAPAPTEVDPKNGRG